MTLPFGRLLPRLCHLNIWRCMPHLPHYHPRRLPLHTHTYDVVPTLPLTTFVAITAFVLRTLMTPLVRHHPTPLFVHGLAAGRRPMHCVAARFTLPVPVDCVLRFGYVEPRRRRSACATRHYRYLRFGHFPLTLTLYRYTCYNTPTHYITCLRFWLLLQHPRTGYTDAQAFTARRAACHLRSPACALAAALRFRAPGRPHACRACVVVDAFHIPYAPPGCAVLPFV